MIGSLKIVLYLLLFATSPAIDSTAVSKTKITAEEKELYEIIMDYRKSKGLERIPLSNSLTFVAQTHCKDLVTNKPDLKSECNTHSWSKNGKWSSCCYTSDHKQANCMWSKPTELTSYQGNGYEIAVGSSEAGFNDYIMTPQYALNSWMKSVHHNNVIVNKDIWKDVKWNAIGIGIHKGFATVWFGQEVDADGEPLITK